MVAAAQVKVGDLILGQRTVRKAAHTDRGALQMALRRIRRISQQFRTALYVVFGA